MKESKSNVICPETSISSIFQGSQFESIEQNIINPTAKSTFFIFQLCTGKLFTRFVTKLVIGIEINLHSCQDHYFKAIEEIIQLKFLISYTNDF